MSEPIAETVYFRDGNVLITSGRADFAGRLYATRHINSVEQVPKPARRARWIALAVFGVLLFIVGISNGNAGDSGVGFICGSVGGAAILAGIGLALSERTRYIVRITTSSGRVDALESARREDIAAIVAAVTRAITAPQS